MSIGLKKVFIIIQRSTLLIAAFIVGSCASFQQPDIIVESNIWSGDINSEDMIFNGDLLEFKTWLNKNKNAWKIMGTNIMLNRIILKIKINYFTKANISTRRKLTLKEVKTRSNERLK